ncbi:hypothetical protein INT47_012175 [Mucor saturninus]|uniref:Uncharacterized protein n=1 Tax=Mucor saturninus TaxID=64648 RepID=A0A8H7QXC2_9FUNG|nr:hypothetical protein INT47_012175 [Mucor saturninus]
MVFDMLSPLLNTSRALPPDNVPTPPSLSSSSPSSNETHLPTSSAPTSPRSYADVAAISSPRVSVTKTAPVNTVPRTNITLFRSSNLEGVPIDPTRNLMHRTGTTEYSVFYQVPKTLLNVRPALAQALSDMFPPGIGLGLSSSDDSNGTTIEISLNYWISHLIFQ